MIIVSKGVLKAKMLEYFRQVEETGEELIVTSHRTPVLRIQPIKPKKSIQEIFGHHWGKVDIPDTIMDPEMEEWGDI